MSGSNPPSDWSASPYQPIPSPTDSGGMPSAQPGMLGVSPSTWQNIAALGSGMLQGANARTADGHLASPGFAGAFGAGVGSYLNSTNQQAQMRSQAAHQQAETQGLNLQNQLNQGMLPLQLQQARFGQMMMDPQFAAEYTRRMQGAFSDQGGASSGGGGAPAGGGYAGAVNGLEGGPQKNPNSSASGYGQLIDQNKLAFAKANPQYFGGAQTAQDVSARFNDPVVGTAATNWMAQQNAPVLSQAGVPITGPNLAMAHRLGPQAVPAVIQAPGDAPLGTTLVSALGPQKAAQYVAANPSMANQTVGQFRSGFANVPAYGPAQGQGGNIMNSFDHTQSDQLFQRADMVSRMPPAVRGMFGDPAAIRQHAQDVFKAESAGPVESATKQAGVMPDLATKGFVPTPQGGLSPIPGGPQDPTQIYRAKQAEGAASPSSIRGPGGANIQPSPTPGGKPTITQSPIEREILGPDGRKWMITQNALESDQQNYMRPTDVPDWAPKGTLTAVPAHMSPGEEAGQKEGAEDAFGEKSRAQYASSLGTIRAMEDMEHQFDTLNSQPGWYNTGAGANWKLEIAKAANSLAASSGAPPVFDAQKIASGEDLTKQTKLAGMQALSSMFGGSKEAASIVTSTQGAVPNIENTPQGGKLVLNGIREGARWQADQHAFMTNWFHDHTGNMVGADVAFNEARPSQMYARRAISQVQPYPIADKSELKRYLPGTVVTMRGVNKVIPGPSDVKLTENANATP